MIDDEKNMPMTDHGVISLKEKKKLVFVIIKQETFMSLIKFCLIKAVAHDIFHM